MDGIVHFEIPSEDITRAGKFYAGVFGWEITPWQSPDANMVYHMANTVPVGADHRPSEPGGINGALMPKNPLVSSPVLVVSVDSVDDALAKVEAAGGETKLPKMAVADMGWYALFADTEGNVLGLFETNKG